MTTREVISARSCAKKAAYTTRPEAMRMRKNIESRKVGADKVRVYHCAECGMWHATTMSKAALREVRMRTRVNA